MVKHIKITTLFSWAVAFSLLTSCMPEIEGKEKETYFSTKTYFQEVIQSLSQEEITLLKEANINGEQENKTLRISQDSTFWQREFQVFMEADINKPALIGQYRVDTVATKDKVTSQEVKEIQYTAQSDDLRTRTMKVWVTVAEQEVVGIHIETSDKNVIYASGQTLSYLADKEYTIDAYQEVVSQPREAYTLRSVFK